ncbi:hypothetical protein [Kaarinaea lacus]
MSNKQLWYTRRDREIRGPFPPGLITRYILLGRILESDELSTDQISWLQVTRLPDLIPPELKLDQSKPENREKLQIARMREDERELVDRRSRNNANINSQPDRVRRGQDRRSSESDDMIRHREIRTQLLESLRQKQKENYISRIIGMLFLFTVVLWFALSYA